VRVDLVGGAALLDGLEAIGHGRRGGRQHDEGALVARSARGRQAVVQRPEEQLGLFDKPL